MWHSETRRNKEKQKKQSIVYAYEPIVQVVTECVNKETIIIL